MWIYYGGSGRTHEDPAAGDVVLPVIGVDPPTAAVVAGIDSEAEPVKQSVVPGRMVNGAMGRM